ncbi:MULTISPECIES: sensor histidine kinase [Pseudomonas]|uniref:histidine kinase n=1 Tax=Pseudomonas baltica TaxID=2762576 RepID=A0A7X1G9I5_9PSED|nr:MULTISPECIES: ATP-binding protein [Pseudomonas]MBC2680154.1 GAF domain-containing protein [Pseudomonas baltica]MBD8605110.1 GAF domain-containing protein [Pseudomonas sp. CFBP 8771]MBD8731213.1 GAF domain-containing protein [Pseudomonas sp. CFBP 13710]MBD8826114.1 GAF domain-containing protein [Pseudomonas sp. CFBP 13602]
MSHSPAPSPIDESERLAALEHLGVLDSVPEPGFDDIVQLATQLCGTPIGLVSLVDRERQWFKACVGLDVSETHRDLAFCAHAILAPDTVMIVQDTHLDLRFKGSPLVLGPPYIRFYAGAPIISRQGLALGTVCVIDTVPRTLDAAQCSALQALARQTAAQLELRLLNAEREQQTLALSRQLDNVLGEHQQTLQTLRHAQRVSSLGQLTAGIAHDFNNLLQAVSASLQMTRLKARKPLEVERLTEIGLQAVRQGAQLIHHLLAFARREEPSVQAVVLDERIEHNSDLFGRALGTATKVQLDLQAPAQAVMCDAHQLDAALLNLLVNARDALRGAGQIRVATCERVVCGDAQLADGTYLCLSVADDGPGIPEDVLVQVFEPFYTTKTAGQGTGLGLSQVYGFASSAEGIARIESRLGEGTTVTLWLRRVAAV